MFNQSPIYSERKSSDINYSETTKSVLYTNLHKTYTNLDHKIFEELVPLIPSLLKEHIRLGHAGIVSNPHS